MAGPRPATTIASTSARCATVNDVVQRAGEHGGRATAHPHTSTMADGGNIASLAAK